MKRYENTASLFLSFRLAYIALVTLPLLRQREQTYTCFTVPLRLAFTLLMLGFQLLLVFLCEWETLQPNVTPFPQTEHFAIYSTSTRFSVQIRTTYYITDFCFCQVLFLFFVKKLNNMLIIYCLQA